MTDRLLRTATRTHSFSESVIREMTRVAREHDAINLAQGFPDFPAPQLLKDAACAAIQGDVNQYAITWGTANLRNALSEKYAAMYDLEFDPEREITVTCGATEAMAAVMLATIDPGEEVIVFETFYENYGPDAVLSQASPVSLPLEAPDYRVERDRLEAVVTPKTRAIVVNTPNNPTGRVFDRDELQAIADICREYDILAITDEIYEHIYYESEHLVLAGFEGMRDRTITVSGLSKTFSVTGWRVGTIMAPPHLTDAIRKEGVEDFGGAPCPVACPVGEFDDDPRLGEGADVAAWMVGGDAQLVAQEHTVDDRSRPVSKIETKAMQHKVFHPQTVRVLSRPRAHSWACDGTPIVTPWS